MKHGTQKIIANKVNISSSYISFLLSGKRRPSWKLAKVLAAQTHTTPELWLDETPEKIREVLESATF